MRATWIRAKVYRESYHEPYPWVYSVETRLGFPIDYGNMATFEEAITMADLTFTSFNDDPFEYFH